MRAGIVVEDWKLPVFRKRLTDAGFVYEDGGAVLPDTTNLIVTTDDVLRLKSTIEACQRECRRKGAPRGA